MTSVMEMLAILCWTGPLLCDEWTQAQPFEVVKQREAGRWMAARQTFKGGGGGEGGTHDH